MRRFSTVNNLSFYLSKCLTNFNLYAHPILSEYNKPDNFGYKYTNFKERNNEICPV